MRHQKRVFDWQALQTNIVANLCILLTGGVSLLLSMMYVYRMANSVANLPQACDWIIIPGHALTKTGDASREFKLRLQVAKRLHKHFPQANLLILGGMSSGQKMSEARVGINYLYQSSDIPKQQLIAEEFSKNTLENLQHAWHYLTPAMNDSLLLVTSRYHLARTLVIAKQLGLDLKPYPAGRRKRLHIKLFMRIVWEGYLLHWYQIGRWYARLTGNQVLLNRVQR